MISKIPRTPRRSGPRAFNKAIKIGRNFRTTRAEIPLKRARRRVKRVSRGADARYYNTRMGT